MSESHAIRCYEYVTAPYERVRDALRADTLGLFQHATTAATARAEKVVAGLRVNLGSLEVYPLSAEETQLDFLGDYRPPGSVVGAAVDAIVGRRVAEATVHQFVKDVSARLREVLAKR